LQARKTSWRKERRSHPVFGIAVTGCYVEIVDPVFDGLPDKLVGRFLSFVGQDQPAKADDGKLLSCAAESPLRERAFRSQAQ
jgi:hypothetical protein